MNRLTPKEIRENPEIRTYVAAADKTLAALGYTDHSYGHVSKAAIGAEHILKELGYDERTVELAWIAGYLHDIGNVVNRVSHAQSGAIMAFGLLGRMGMDPEEIAAVTMAIGHHDEGTAEPVSPMAAALILADKSDVRRTRVRNRDIATFDIHDRVNYAVEQSELVLDAQAKTIALELKIDTHICSVMDYFEIFLTRMILCRRAADYLGLTFQLHINGSTLL